DDVEVEVEPWYAGRVGDDLVVDDDMRDRAWRDLPEHDVDRRHNYVHHRPEELSGLLNEQGIRRLAVRNDVDECFLRWRDNSFPAGIYTQRADGGACTGG